MRRRLPSPALVIASIALFVALAGAGAAASLFLVRSTKPVMLMSGSVGLSGTISGAGLSGGRVSEGVYVITIRGDSFAPARNFPRVRATVTPEVITIIGGNGASAKLAPSCAVASRNIASNGGATAEVDCFKFDAASGDWVPTDAAFDLQLVGPSR